MDKKGKIALISALVLAVILVMGIAMAAKKECNDGKDNDGDGNVDMADGGCSGPGDNDETNCGDGVCEGGETVGSCPADCGTPDSCSDTDGGNVIAVFGTTSGYYNNNPYSYDDYCVDSSNIMEYYCSGDYGQSSQQSCGTDSYGSEYCSAGDTIYKDLTDYFCSSGVCDSDVTPEFVEDCDDSDGYSAYYCANSTTVVSDLTDYYCSSGACDYVQYPVVIEECTYPEQCISGGCVVQNSCSDSDGGLNEAVYGTVSGYSSGYPYSFPDYCFDATTLVEYVCYGDYYYNENVSCTTGNYTSCSGGECV